ncbi:hypothetical protein EON64_21225 [archaeon]|nr:MAG: hypothetical protein EON64_21225 [archaeon]
MGKKKIHRTFTYLDDSPNDSVSQVVLKCRDVLWGIVQKISIQQDFEEVEEQAVVDDDLLGSMDLPSGFGGMKAGKSRKNKKRKRNAGNAISLPYPIHNGIILESNVCLIFGDAHCVLCPSLCSNCMQHAARSREAYVRVIGVGPTQPAGQFAIVQPLNTPLVFEISRDELHSIPPARFLEVGREAHRSLRCCY